MERRWSRSTKNFVVGLFLLAVIWLINTAAPLIGPLLIAVILAYVLNSIVHLLIRRTALTRERAAVIAYVLFVLIIIAIPSILTPVLAGQLNRLSSDVDRILIAVDAFIGQPIQVGQFALDPPLETMASLEEEIRDVVSQGSSRALEMLSGLGANLGWLIIIFVTTFYLLRDGLKLRDWFIRQFPSEYQADVGRLVHAIDAVWGAYLRGQVILAAIVGGVTGLSMAIVGLRGAWMIGIFAGVLDLIPSLGPLLGGLTAVIVALVLGSSRLAVSRFWFGVIVLGIFALIQQLENIWLRPRILGNRLKIHPALVVIGVLGALILTGVLGALVVIPIMASIFVLTRYAHAKLLDRDPWARAGTGSIPMAEGWMQGPQRADRGAPAARDMPADALQYYKLETDGKRIGYVETREGEGVFYWNTRMERDGWLIEYPLWIKYADDRAIAFKVGSNDYQDIPQIDNVYPSVATHLLLKMMKDRDAITYRAFIEASGEITNELTLRRRGNRVEEYEGDERRRYFDLEAGKVVEYGWGETARARLVENLDEAKRGTAFA